MPTDEIPGRALVTRRAITDIVRRAALGSYGVAGFDTGPFDRLRALIDGTHPGVRIGLSDTRLSIRLRLRVASGLPVAEVARQVDSAVRHAIRQAVRREVDELAVRVGGLDASPGSDPPAPPARPGPGNADLADSGVDVA